MEPLTHCRECGTEMFPAPILGHELCLDCRPDRVNLYAIRPVYSPEPPTLILAHTDEEAMAEGVAEAAADVVNVNYCSPYAEVFLVAADLRKVGDAYASDAPAGWGWAHPAVEENAAEEACLEADAAAGFPGDRS